MRVGAELNLQQSPRATSLQTVADTPIAPAAACSAPSTDKPPDGQALVILVPEDDPRPAKRPRRHWDLSALPAHLRLEDNGFTKSYHCDLCGCFNSTKTRSQFFATHWECQGIADLPKRNRHFIRKSSLPVNRDAAPRGAQVTDVQWYQQHGQLPISIQQPWPGAPLTCRGCGASTPQCNRRKFMQSHLACLAPFLTWHSDGSVSIDTDGLDRGTKRTNPSTFVSEPPNQQALQ
eukprot:6489914-Amphidinium_carterae.1